MPFKATRADALVEEAVANRAVAATQAPLLVRAKEGSPVRTYALSLDTALLNEGVCVIDGLIQLGSARLRARGLGESAALK